MNLILNAPHLFYNLKALRLQHLKLAILIKENKRVYNLNMDD